MGSFIIEHSVAADGRFALAPPDVATCADCIAEFTSPGNRRFGYPFTNCTNCGPRYSIIRDVPYDRREYHHGGVRDVRSLPAGI